jgi:hypothetical protein
VFGIRAMEKNGWKSNQMQKSKKKIQVKDEIK